GGDPAAVLYVHTLGLSPLADLSRIHPVRRCLAPAAGRPPGRAAGPAGSANVGRECVPQCLSVLGVQVDLVVCAVKAEADGPFGSAAIDVVNKQGLHFLRHGCSNSRTDEPIVGNSSGTSTQPHRNADQTRYRKVSE